MAVARNESLTSDQIKQEIAEKEAVNIINALIISMQNPLFIGSTYTVQFETPGKVLNIIAARLNPYGQEPRFQILEAKNIISIKPIRIIH